MTSVSDIYGSGGDWLKPSDLEGKTRVELVDFELVEVPDFNNREKMNKRVAWHLRNTDKLWIMNRQSGIEIEQAYGVELEGWKGKKVILSTRKLSAESKPYILGEPADVEVAEGLGQPTTQAPPADSYSVDRDDIPF
jgi:hypothetical protein